MDISFITAHKGAASDLRRCIRSVYLDLGSSRFRTYEHLVYLDGVLGLGSEYDFLYDYDHVRVFKFDHSQGKAACVNELLSLSTGKYIFFIDSDDLSLRGRTEAQVEILAVTESTVVGANFYFWGPDNTFVYSNYPCSNKQIKFLFWKYPYLLYSSMAMRSEDLRARNIRLNENIRGGIDYELYSRMFESMQVVNIAKPLVAYKVNSQGGITNSSATRKEQLSVHKDIMGDLLGIDKSCTGEIIRDILFSRLVIGTDYQLSVEERGILKCFIGELRKGTCRPSYFCKDINEDEFCMYLATILEELVSR